MVSVRMMQKNNMSSYGFRHRDANNCMNSYGFCQNDAKDDMNSYGFRQNDANKQYEFIWFPSS